MSIKNKTRGGAIGRAFAVMNAAISVSAAVESRRRPNNRDLQMLGIDPKAFDRFV